MRAFLLPCGNFLRLSEVDQGKTDGVDRMNDTGTSEPAWVLPGASFGCNAGHRGRTWHLGFRLSLGKGMHNP